MIRRWLPVAALLAALTAFGGCGYGAPAALTQAQKHARIHFIERHGDYTDHELARLCPGLYPRDYLTNTKKYAKDKVANGHKAPTVTAADRAEAKAAGCHAPA
jgi:hypothetical protein